MLRAATLMERVGRLTEAKDLFLRLGRYDDAARCATKIGLSKDG